MDSVPGSAPPGIPRAAPVTGDVVEVIDDSEDEAGGFVIPQVMSAPPEWQDPSQRRSQDSLPGLVRQGGVPMQPDPSMAHNLSSAFQMHDGAGPDADVPEADGPSSGSPQREDIALNVPGPGLAVPMREGAASPGDDDAVGGPAIAGGESEDAHDSGHATARHDKSKLAMSPAKREREEEAGTCTICFEPFTNSGLLGYLTPLCICGPRLDGFLSRIVHISSAFQPQTFMEISHCTCTHALILSSPRSHAGDHRLVCLGCGHLFGALCIQRWLTEKCRPLFVPRGVPHALGADSSIELSSHVCRLHFPFALILPFAQILLSHM